MLTVGERTPRDDSNTSFFRKAAEGSPRGSSKEPGTPSQCTIASYRSLARCPRTSRCISHRRACPARTNSHQSPAAQAGPGAVLADACPCGCVWPGPAFARVDEQRQELCSVFRRGVCARPVWWRVDVPQVGERVVLAPSLAVGEDPAWQPTWVFCRPLIQLRRDGSVSPVGGSAGSRRAMRAVPGSRSLVLTARPCTPCLIHERGTSRRRQRTAALCWSSRDRVEKERKSKELHPSRQWKPTRVRFACGHESP